MSKPPLDYETPSPDPVRPSPLWWIVRLTVAVPFALWGFLMAGAGVEAMAEGKPHYAAQFLWGIVLIAIAVAAIRLPVRRRSG